MFEEKLRSDVRRINSEIEKIASSLQLTKDELVHFLDALPPRIQRPVQALYLELGEVLHQGKMEVLKRMDGSPSGEA